MIEHEQFLKLKKQAMIYCPYRTSVAITEDFQHYCDFQSDQVHIHLGKKAPYRYAKKLHPIIFSVSGREFGTVGRGKSTRKIIAEKSNILNQESRAGRKRSARLFCVLSGFSDLHAIIFLASLTSVACVQMNSI